MAELSKELQEAILAMPVKEKDKILLRLIVKDEKLCQKLEYELLEEGATLDERRQELRNFIEQMVRSNHETHGWLMMYMRSVNGSITQHDKTTNDNYGEVSLTLHMLNRVYDEQMPHIQKYSHRSDTLASYVAKRTQFILQKLEKMHPDYYIEFEDDVNKLLQRVHTTAPSRYAQELGIPKKWVHE